MFCRELHEPMSKEMSSPNPAASKNYLYGLDLLRFVAAFLVMVFHLAFSVWASPKSGLANLRTSGYALEDLQWLTWPGWIGVEIFFVISGLVIANSANGKSLLSFLRSRSLRLYPAVWICSIVTLVFVSGYYEPVSLVNRLARSITLFPLHPWIDPVYWTLAVEIVFYFTIGIMLGLNRFHRLPAFALWATLGSLIYQALVLAKNFGFDAISLPELGLQASRLTLLDHAAFFALGIYIWLGTSGKATRTSKIGLYTSLVCCLIEITNHTLYVLRLMSNARIDEPLAVLLPGVIWICAVAFIYLSSRYSFVFTELPQSVRSAIRTLGLMTFPLYLLHFSVGVWITDRLVAHANLGAGLALAIAMALLLALSFFVCTKAEPMVRRLLGGVWMWIEAGILSSRHAKALTRATRSI